MSKNILCSYASLNACSLIKTQNRQTQSEYIRYLRLQHYDILCFQETQARTPELISSLDIHFQPQSSHWTKHVGVVSRSPNFHITTIDTSHIFADTRFQLCIVEHPQKLYEPFFILNIYAPANTKKNRQVFFSQLVNMLYGMQDQITFDRLIISGDFNYSLLRPNMLTQTTSAEWLHLLELFFYNSMHMNNLIEIPTFQRTRGGSITSSVIDYIYVGQHLKHQLQDTSISRLNSAWTDHSLLHICFSVGVSSMGPGLWRANPIYSTHTVLQQLIKKKINSLLDSFDNDISLLPEHKWDKIKSATKKVIRTYSYEYVNWRKITIKQLEKRRNRILRGKPNLALRLQLLGPLDQKLGQLQQELTEIDALKAGARWRENGEKSAGFLKRIHHKRTTQQHMTSVKCLDHGHTTITIEASNTNDHTSDPTAMRDVVRQYYQQLYTQDHVEPNAIDDYLHTIHFEKTVSREDNADLVAPITIDDLIEQVKRSPKHSSPGNDGLGYQYLKLLFEINRLQPLILEVYNRALLEDITPNTWKEIRVRLLPKKGDLADLKNWRPISLINCDAKVFTRLINHRLGHIAQNIVQPSQTGFMKGRFIGDNGLILHLLLQQARYRNYPGIGLLLDQEKAYDRVHPLYLIKVLESLGFSSRFTQCIKALFFGNSVQVNVNGFFSPTVHQQRGLRQGDPLSPILFNLALEPLLLAINQDLSLNGYQYTNNGTSQSVKTLAYADDICVILKNQDDYRQMQQHIRRYSAVSNAKFNQSKTEAFSLTGRSDDNWNNFLNQQNIHTYYSNRSIEPFRYLGYYMVYTPAQRNHIQGRIITSIKDQVKLYSTRQVSLRGRATIINTLIMTKAWYMLRLLQPTQTFLRTMKSISYNFVWNKKRPLVSFDQLCLPFSQGGIGLISPETQHLVLQVRHLQHLFTSSSSPMIVRQLFLYHMSIISDRPGFGMLSFFVPELRNHALNHSSSILHSCYKAFDRFHFRPDFSKASLQTILLLPLRYLFVNIPSDHWIHRHPQFPATKFFIYDQRRNRLRLQVEPEYTVKPQLCGRLKKQILQLRTMQLQPYLWRFITMDVPPEILNGTADNLTSQFLQLSTWKNFDPRTFRLPNDSQGTSILSSVSPKALSYFWSAPMFLQARSLWYRVMCKKIPHTSFLYKIKTVDSPNCRLCHGQEDTLSHFLVYCPQKRIIWETVLNYHFPTFEFSVEDILQLLYSLHSPFPSHSSLQISLIATISTILWNTWIFYWQFIIQHSPFQTEVIINKTLSQISTLLTRQRLD